MANLNRQQTERMVLRYLMATDASIDTVEEINKAEQFVRGLPEFELQSVAHHVSSDPQNAQMYSDVPEATVPMPSESDIMGAVGGGAGGGGRLGMRASGQGGPPATDYGVMAREAAGRAGIDPERFVRQIQNESGLNPNGPDSSAGARGIAQLMPVHWPKVDPRDPQASLDYAANLMSSHLGRYGGDWSQALAAYNWGPGNLQSAGNDVGRAPSETRAYIQRITGEPATDAPPGSFQPGPYTGRHGGGSGMAPIERNAPGFEPPAPTAGPAPTTDLERRNAIVVPIETMIQRVAVSRDRRDLTVLDSLVATAYSSILSFSNVPEGKDPESPQASMLKWIGGIEKGVDNLRASIPAERAGGADNGPAWANYGLARDKFAYDQARDVVTDERQARQDKSKFTGFEIDPDTGEIRKSLELQRLEEERSSRLSANTGTYTNEAGEQVPTRSAMESDRTYQRLVDQERQNLRRQMANDFVSQFSRHAESLVTLRAQAMKEAEEQSLRRPYAGSPGYVRDYEPGGFMEQMARLSGQSFTPRDIATYGVPAQDPYRNMNEYQQMMEPLLNRMAGGDYRNPSIFEGLYGQ